MYFFTTNKRLVLHFIPVVVSVIVLAACTGPEPNQKPKINLQAPLTHSSDWYLQKLQQNSNQNNTDLQLLALSALLTEDKIAQATELANTMPSNLTAIQQTEFNILNADLSLRYNDVNSANAKLKNVDPKALSPSQSLRFYQLVIAGHAEVGDVALLRAYLALQSRLQGDAARKNLNATWHALSMIPPETAGGLVINANEYTLAGWLDLLSCVNQNKNNAGDLVTAFRDWQIRYPDHPAAKQIPDELQTLLATTDFSTLNKVAVLLPLTGPGAVYSKAIEQGIGDAHDGAMMSSQRETNSTSTNNSSLNAQSEPARPVSEVVSGSDTAQENIAPPPVNSISTDTVTDKPNTGQDQPAATTTSKAPATLNDTVSSLSYVSSAEIKFYDTNTQSVTSLVQQAQQDGAQLIIGPLLKSDVEQVTKINLPVNILALNQIENPSAVAHVCYFSLSPEDEAKNAAEHIWAQNKRVPLLLIPNSELGKRIVSAFSHAWYQLGGEQIYQQNFGDLPNLKGNIGSRDGMALKGQLVARELPMQPSDQPMPVIEANASAASSPDAVYIVANQSELGLIKPMITMNIGAKNDLAFYASSLSSQGGAGPDFRFEMEGLEFSDIPLLSGEITEDGKRIIHQFNDDYNQVRLYALGADAWQLAQHYNELRQPAFSLIGQTGKLQADSHCVLNRTLTWSRYSQGKIVPVQ